MVLRKNGRTVLERQVAAMASPAAATRRFPPAPPDYLEPK